MGNVAPAGTPRSRSAAPAGTPRFRDAAPADAPRIVEIVEAAYRGHGGWTTEADLVTGNRTTPAEVETLIAADDTVVLVAEHPSGALVGCCYTHREDARAEFGLFAVDPAAQSGGIGRGLLDEQIRRMRELDVRELEILVLQNRPEIRAWYLRRGFAATGDTVAFPADPASLRTPGLRMEVLVKRLGTGSE